MVGDPVLKCGEDGWFRGTLPSCHSTGQWVTLYSSVDQMGGSGAPSPPAILQVSGRPCTQVWVRWVVQGHPPLLSFYRSVGDPVLKCGVDGWFRGTLPSCHSTGQWVALCSSVGQMGGSGAPSPPVTLQVSGRPCTQVWGRWVVQGHPPLLSFYRSVGDTVLKCGSDGWFRGTLPSCHSTGQWATLYSSVGQMGGSGAPSPPVILQVSGQPCTQVWGRWVVQRHPPLLSFYRSVGDPVLKCGADGWFRGTLPSCHSTGQWATLCSSGGQMGGSEAPSPPVILQVSGQPCTQVWGRWVVQGHPPLLSFYRSVGDPVFKCGADGWFRGTLPSCHSTGQWATLYSSVGQMGGSEAPSPPVILQVSGRPCTQVWGRWVVQGHPPLLSFYRSVGNPVLKCGADGWYRDSLPSCHSTGQWVTLYSSVGQMGGSGAPSPPVIVQVGDSVLKCGADGWFRDSLPSCHSTGQWVTLYSSVGQMGGSGAPSHPVILQVSGQPCTQVWGGWVVQGHPPILSFYRSVGDPCTQVWGRRGGSGGHPPLLSLYRSVGDSVLNCGADEWFRGTLPSCHSTGECATPTQVWGRWVVQGHPHLLSFYRSVGKPVFKYGEDGWFRGTIPSCHSTGQWATLYSSVGRICGSGAPSPPVILQVSGRHCTQVWGRWVVQGHPPLLSFYRSVGDTVLKCGADGWFRGTLPSCHSTGQWATLYSSVGQMGGSGAPSHPVFLQVSGRPCT